MNESLTPQQQSDPYSNPSVNSHDGTVPSEGSYEQHPLSAAFPAMNDEELQNLKDSIDVIGVQNPIVIFEGKILDGWHRYIVATELRLPCPVIYLEEDMDPRDFVLANNKARRHLSRGQIAMAYTKVYQWNPSSKKASRGEPSSPQKTNEELAEMAGTSTRTIQHAKTILTKGAKSVQEAVQNGKISLKRGAKISRLELDEQYKALMEPPEPRPSLLDGNEPSEEELMANDLAMEADLKQVQEFLEADDKLKEQWEKNKELNRLYAISTARCAALMKEKNEYAKFCKKVKYHNKKLYEERDKCPTCKEKHEKYLDSQKYF